MEKQTIAIVGCGWLGIPLAKRLLNSGHTVFATTRNTNHQSELIDLGAQVTATADDVVFESCDAVVILLPFKRDIDSPWAYHEQVVSIVENAAKAEVNQLIWTGSTSIYPKSSGVYEEDTVFEPENERARVLLAIERDIKHHFPQNGVALRVGGLVGQGRDSSRTLNSNVPIARPLDSIALVHQDDVVQLIVSLLNSSDKFQIYNVTSGETLIRKAYYCAAAKRLGLPAPYFEMQDPKDVIVRKICARKCHQPDWNIHHFMDLL
ncbi:MAG: NAD(P)-binding domain-containing protein [bacterium]|nr:NAD(P)-binding domain-containing protein [bacterium]